MTFRPSVSTCIALVHILGLMIAMPSSGYADTQTKTDQSVVSLPSRIADVLRSRNIGGRYGCPESSIFVHGFRSLGVMSGDSIWFLGAPDYFCETNSFMTATLNSSGEWSEGWAKKSDNSEAELLAGVPALFQYSADMGFFLTTEWQVEGPGNFLYFSADGESWSSINLPEAEGTFDEFDCCYAPEIHRLCIDESNRLFIEYDESDDFRASVWSAHVGASFSKSPKWSQLPELPAYLRCDGQWDNEFLPRSLIEKTEKGAKFRVSNERVVLIPGPTK